MEKKVINHFCHEHPLILSKQASDKESLYCYGCGYPVTNLEWAYVCEQPYCSSSSRSRIILHERCGELARQIFSHASHPQHPLHIFDYRRLPRNTCNLCYSYIGSKLGYRCPSCEFDFHIECREGGILPKEKRQVQHPSHVHPLTLMRKPAFSFTCDGCATQDVDTAYICSTCEYWLHETCASLPIILPKEDRHRHHHHLSLAFYFPMEHRKYIYKCDVCDKDFDMTCWLYFCGDCRFFVHPKCVGSSTKPDHVVNVDHNDGSDLIWFPLNDISKDLIRPFVMREKGVDNIPDVNNMPATVKMPETTAKYSFLFNYHKHPLSLVSVSHDDRVMEEDDDEEESEVESKICNVCITPVSSPPYYECVACKYFVHSICYFLPKTLSSSSSSSSTNSPHLYGDCSNTDNKIHKFTLCTSYGEGDKKVYVQWCRLCGFYTNGMVYECDGCRMQIDVKCASLPTTIRHASHPHHKHLTKTRLPEIREKWKACYGCGAYFQHPSIVYLCSSEGCDFGLDLNCALLPPSIDHDKHTDTGDKHLLLLTYDASLNHPDDFYCQFCEQEMHPKRWMYYCCECDSSFHTRCLRAASGWFRNTKFGQRFELDGIHPHPLTFNYVTLKKRCDICDMYVYTDGGLECASCYYVVCMYCAREQLHKISRST